MKNFLSKNAKLIYLLCGVFSLLTLILSVGFMTQYRYLRLNYIIETNAATGEERIVIGAQGSLNGADQQALFDFIRQLDTVDQTTGKTMYEDAQAYKEHHELEEIREKYVTNGKLNEDIKMQIFNYRKRLDSYNAMIVLLTALSLVSFAFMFIFGNHSRRIYYKSNLIAGVALPAIIAIFNLVLIVMSFGLMSELSGNYYMYNLVSVLQNPLNYGYTQIAKSAETNAANLLHIVSAYDCNSTTFILYDLLFGFVMLYNIFLIVFAILKYRWTAERRAEVIERSKIVGDLI